MLWKRLLACVSSFFFAQKHLKMRFYIAFCHTMINEKVKKGAENLTMQHKNGVFKKIIGVIILLGLCVSMISCGTTDNVFKIVKKGEKLRSGTFETIVSVSEEKNGSLYSKPTIKFSGYYDGKQKLVSYECDDGGTVTSLENVILYGNGTLYINMGLAAEGAVSVKHHSGEGLSGLTGKWIALPSYTSSDESVKLRDTLRDGIIDALEAGVDEDATLKDDTTYSLNIDDADVLSGIAKAWADHVEQSGDAIISMLTAAKAGEIMKALSEACGSGMDANKVLADIINSIVGAGTDEGMQMDSTTDLQEAVTLFTKLLSQKLESISDKMAESGSQSYLHMNVSLTGSGKNKVYEKKIEIKYPDGDIYKTVKIDSVFNENHTVSIYPPEEGSIAPTSSVIAQLNTILSLYGPQDNETEETEPVDTTLFAEENVPKYNVDVKGRVITCTQDTPLYTERVTYTTDGTVVTDITMEMTTVNQDLFYTFVYHYEEMGFSVKSADTSFFEAGSAAEHASLVMVAKPQTVQWWAENVQTFEQLVARLSA